MTHIKCNVIEIHVKKEIAAYFGMILVMTGQI